MGSTAPLVALLALAASGGEPPSLPLLAAAAGSAGAIALAAWVSTRRPRVAAGMVTLGAAGAGAACAPALGDSPGVALLTALFLTWLIYLAWRPEPAVPTRLVFRPSGGAVGAAAGASGLAALAAWFAGATIGAGPDGYTTALVAVAELVNVAFALRWARSAPPRRRQVVWIGTGVALAGAVALALAGRITGALSAAAVPAAATVAAAAWRSQSGAGTWNELFNHQARLLIVTFLLLCFAGTVVLSLPVCSADHTRLPLVDAAFTAISAVCVTGLIVRDTPHDFTGAGQAVILLLIQLGGLGIMTFATAAIGLLGRRMSIRQERVAAELLNERNRAALYVSLRRTLMVTFGFELAAVPVLAAVFTNFHDTLGQALWRGTFTAVSAFCNAGFALQTDSLIPYQTSGVVIHVTALLIVAGGLSPFVIAAVPGLVRGRRPVLRTRVILWTTGLLLAGAFLLVTALEWNASLGGLSWMDRLNNAWFQCLTPRTAGFNSVEMSALRPATLSFLMILMFIGGSPGGTAGGIKTTTFFVLTMAIISVMRGRSEIQVFHRRIPHSTLYRAAAIATLGVLSVAMGLIAIQVTQRMPADMAMFEVVSALGTVGLSVGGTPLLDSVGKVIIMVCMFLGRVGPLTAFLLLADHRADPVWRAPEEELELG